MPICVSTCCCMCICVVSLRYYYTCYDCPHTTIHVSSSYYMCRDTDTCVGDAGGTGQYGRGLTGMQQAAELSVDSQPLS
jgi:hypothetical protein